MFKETKISKIKTTESFMDSLIYSSCRYFIGRHTIHAHSAATELAEFLRDNNHILSADRREWLARDIRERINDAIHYTSNVYMSGTQQVHRPDALILISKEIVKYLAEHPEKHWGGEDENSVNFGDWDWDVDLNAQEVTMRPRKGSGKIYATIFDDLVVWSKLAGWLDPYELITVNSAEIFEEPGFAFPSIGRYVNEEHMHFHLGHITAECYIKTPHADTYIDEQYIGSIEPI